MDKKEKLHNLRHSLAHILASAVLEMFPKAQLGVGPVLENGFYYDFLLPRPLTPQDLAKLEKRMRELVKQKLDFKRDEMTFVEAKKYFQGKNQPFKIELIGDIEKHGTTVFKDITGDSGAPAKNAGNKTPGNEDKNQSHTVSIYHTGKFSDLCRGGHVENTSEIKPDSFKLERVSGAYWRGDQKNPQLQRIYGLSFETKEELEKYIQLQTELERRDHKKLGPRLGLFMFHETAPGIPYWLPKGVLVLNGLVNFWRKEHAARGYQEIMSPLINKKELWETSGHWDHYKEDMFVANMGENEIYGIKPMNCPNAMVVFGSQPRSYKDLPLRFSDTDMLHRYELSGALNGLLRARSFRQDDSHNFISEDQIEEEFMRILEIAEKFYSIFGLDYKLRLGTRPESYMGDLETWNKAEAALKKILKASKKEYFISEGDGAFYGPKIDIVMQDALGREWQTGTIQLDFQQPRRFNLEYTAKDGSKKTPVVIHRVIYGSLERFIAILIEQFEGAFPFWLSPVQIAILPISDKQNKYAAQVAASLKKELPDLRIETDDRSESIGRKIREAELQKVPYMLVLGEKEMKAKKIAVRTRGQKDLGAMPLKKFLARVSKELEK